MSIDKYNLLKYDLKKEIRAKLEREYLLSLPENACVEEQAQMEVMDELRMEDAEIVARDYSRLGDMPKSDFIGNVLERDRIARIIEEGVDWSEYYNEDGSLKDTELP